MKFITLYEYPDDISPEVQHPGRDIVLRTSNKGHVAGRGSLVTLWRQNKGVTSTVDIREGGMCVSPISGQSVHVTRAIYVHFWV